MMESNFTLIESSTSIRNEPVNLISDDCDLFRSEFLKQINKTTACQIINADIIYDTVYNLKLFRNYSSYTNILKIGLSRKIRRILVFFYPAVTVPEGIWITDELSSAYFHWITDALPKLIAAENLVGSRKVILPDTYKTYPFIEASLKQLNYTSFYYDQKKRLRVGSLLMIGSTAPTGNYNNYLINKLRTKFLNRTLNKPFRKVFISRQKAVQRKIINELEIQELLITYGYEIHNFEDYTLQTQINIMSETKFMIGLHGAGLTNMLFMQPKGKILELRNQNDNHNNCYFSLASDLEHDYYYLNNTSDNNNTHITNIYVDIQKLLNILNKMD